MTTPSLGLYNLIWKALRPLLPLHPKLSDCHRERCLGGTLPRSDIWIQSASGGEAYLSWAVIKELSVLPNLRVLATTNTRQGMEILQLASADIKQCAPGMRVSCAFFPYDMPDIMNRAVAQVRPAVTVLLETEIWPGFMSALRNFGSRILIVNGRIREESLRKYRIWPSFWPQIKPDRILAVSAADANRFNQLFESPVADVMPNIKFDRFQMPASDESPSNPLQKLISGKSPFVVLGSVRKEEEKDIGRLIEFLRKNIPDITIGLFPRHMERIDHWRKFFLQKGTRFALRSETRIKSNAGTVLLWDVFGELHDAYRLADAAFVGGSLAPLGGQNFLEPLSCGIVPIIGPSWSNFHWVGREIMTCKLVRMGNTWREIGALLLENLEKKDRREAVMTEAASYIASRRGGTQSVGRLIQQYLIP